MKKWWMHHQQVMARQACTVRLLEYLELVLRGIAHGGESRGVYGSGKVGVYGYGATGIWGGTNATNGNAGRFSGNVKVTGDLEIDGLNNEIVYPDGTRQRTAFVPQNLFYSRSFKTEVIGPNTSNVVNCFCDQGDIAIGGGWGRLSK